MSASTLVSTQLQARRLRSGVCCDLTMSYETILLEMREAVGIITLNRPASLNALTTEVGQEFQTAVVEVQGRGARAVIITGAGRAFCAGGDLREMQRIAEQEGKVEAFFD